MCRCTPVPPPPRARYEVPGYPIFYFPRMKFSGSDLKETERDALVLLARKHVDPTKEGKQSFMWGKFEVHVGVRVVKHGDHPGWADFEILQCRKTGIYVDFASHVYCGVECRE